MEKQKTDDLISKLPLILKVHVKTEPKEKQKNSTEDMFLIKTISQIAINDQECSQVGKENKPDS